MRFSTATIYRSILMIITRLSATHAIGSRSKHLDQKFLENPRRLVDQLLHWHFRQAVRANMRRPGDPIFELDFPPGSDMMGEVMSGPNATERMEFELSVA